MTPDNYGYTIISTVQKELPSDFFLEWGRQLEHENVDAYILANFYMSLLSDEKNSELRSACAAFAVLMKTRSWDEMLALIKGFVDEKTHRAMSKPGAAAFYDQFRSSVIAHIEDYYKQLVKQAKKQPKKRS